MKKKDLYNEDGALKKVIEWRNKRWTRVELESPFLHVYRYRHMELVIDKEHQDYVRLVIGNERAGEDPDISIWGSGKTLVAAFRALDANVNRVGML